MVNYYAGFPTLLASGRQISGYLLASDSRTALTQIPPCRLFLVASSSTSCCAFERFRSVVLVSA